MSTSLPRGEFKLTMTELTSSERDVCALQLQPQYRVSLRVEAREVDYPRSRDKLDVIARARRLEGVELLTLLLSRSIDPKWCRTVDFALLGFQVVDGVGEELDDGFDDGVRAASDSLMRAVVDGEVEESWILGWSTLQPGALLLLDPPR